MFEIEDKMRIAQMVVSKYEKVNFELVSHLSESERGSGVWINRNKVKN